MRFLSKKIGYIVVKKFGPGDTVPNEPTITGIFKNIVLNKNTVLAFITVI